MSNKDYVYDYIANKGMLLLNRSNHFDSLMEIQGDWNSIMDLIEDKKVYFSKIFNGKTTYLSDEMYPYFKVLNKDSSLSVAESKILSILEQHEGCETNFLKILSAMEKKVFDVALNGLLRKMYITVLRRGKIINSQWTAYTFGTDEQWRNGNSDMYSEISSEEAFDKIFHKLSPRLTNRKIMSFLKQKY